MSEHRSATHRHKTRGPVIIIESTAQLARVVAVEQGDEMWVKLSDLTEGAQAVTKKRSQPKTKDRPSSSANSSYRIVRAV